MNKVYILIGGNLGNKYTNLQSAKEFLEKEIGNIEALSSIYETAAWGNNNQPNFYNQVLIIKTKFSAEKIMEKILKIETVMGRIRTEKNAARLIDIDILFFNDETINQKNLVIPHPEISNRRFVLIPLNELSPELYHPVLHKTISQLLATCKDELEVNLLETV